MAVEGLRVELGENVDFVDAAVDAVAHGHVNQAVGSTDGDLLRRSRNDIHRYSDNEMINDVAVSYSSRSRESL